MSTYSYNVEKALQAEVKRHKGRAKASRRKLITKLARNNLFCLTGEWKTPKMDTRFREDV